MALVLWTYNNPRVDSKTLESLSFPFCGQTIKIEQNLNIQIDRRQNTNYKVWSGSFLLASYIEQKENNFWNNKKCLELGAGCGLVGMVAGMMGAWVTLTDLPLAMHHTNHCLSLNQHLPNITKVTTAPYTWGSHADSDDDSFKDIDFIFASDILYHPDLNQELIATFKQLCGQQTTVLLCYKERGLGEEAFFGMLEREGFSCGQEEMHTHRYKNPDYKIYSIRRCIN